MLERIEAVCVGSVKRESAARLPPFRDRDVTK